MAFLRKRGKNYFVRFSYRGKEYEKSCRTTQKTVAEVILKEIEGKVARKSFKIEELEEPKQRFLEEFIPEYLSYSRTNKSPRTVEIDASALEKFNRLEGNLPLDSITLQMIEGFKTELLKSKSQTTVNITLRCLQAAMEKAVKWGYIGGNPFKEVSQIKTPEGNEPFMKTNEIKELLKVIKVSLYHKFISTALYTGMRVTEICNLKWEDVDFDHHKIHVRNTIGFSTKSKKERTIPLHPKVSVALKGVERNGSPFIFLKESGEILDKDLMNKVFRRYCKRAGLDERYHFHTLRHTFASHLAIKGVSLYFIQKMLGHQSIETTARIYAHLQPEPLLDAVKQLHF